MALHCAGFEPAFMPRTISQTYQQILVNGGEPGGLPALGQKNAARVDRLALNMVTALHLPCCRSWNGNNAFGTLRLGRLAAQAK